MKIEKAIEIREARIGFVSLVDKAANKRQFLIAKADDGKAQFSTLGKILKIDTDTHYVTGVVYEPLVEDTHGNFMTEAEIRKAAYWFAKNGDQVDLQHSFEQVDGVTVVETYVAPCDMEVGGEPIAKGTWLMTMEVQNPEVWEKVQKGEVTGFSMGGMGQYSEVDTNLAEVVEKRGLLQKFADWIGIDLVEKGAVAEKYARSTKASSFWNAWYALQDVLYPYNWQTDRYEFNTNEETVREALAEFSAILLDVLGTSSVTTTLAESLPVEKAGKKISGKNRETLQSIHDSLGELLTNTADQEKEDESVTKAEIQAQVDEAVKKALESAPATAEAAPEPEGTITPDVVQKMVDEAIQKAKAPTEEAVTLEMVEEIVAKALAPILKARGLSSNLNGETPVEKSEGHYLKGIL